jgi:Uncharacterized protein conserved in bacteria
MIVNQEVLLVAGYKPYELGIFSDGHPGIPVIRHCLHMHLQEMADAGLKWVVISGEPGVELWAGEETIGLRKVYPDLKLAVLAPFLGQDERYKDWIKMQYQSILEKADFTGTISNRPYESPVQLRQKNDFLVAKTDGMLILYDEETPGSPRYYLAAARKRAGREAYPITTIDRYDLELASEDLQEQNPDYWAQK